MPVLPVSWLYICSGRATRLRQEPTAVSTQARVMWIRTKLVLQMPPSFLVPAASFPLQRLGKSCLQAPKGGVCECFVVSVRPTPQFEQLFFGAVPVLVAL